MTLFHPIDAGTLPQTPASGSVIIDVRTDMEHAEKRLACQHMHVPLDRLDPKAVMDACQLGPDAEVILLCRSGGRAAKAAELFAKAGYNRVKVITGGLLACEACGHAVTGAAAGQCATGTITLERQVRIVAGAIGAAGALLALIVSPLFALIPLFVGSGLVFAGITDRCGMALLLTKAPWNRPTGMTKPVN